jgi:hypothetical protein
MSKIEEAKEILKALGLPTAQRNEMSAYTFLALCNIREQDNWINATRQSLGVSKGIMNFVNLNYGKIYAPNTRETFRRQVLHQFVQGRIVDYNPDNPKLPVNSPRAHYAINIDVLEIIKKFNTHEWDEALNHFISSVGTLSEVYLKERELNKIPVKLLNGETVNLSAGLHNEVQAAIIEQFAPRFAPNSILLYLGDTEKKDLVMEIDFLYHIGIQIDAHSKLPDVMLFDPSRDWLFMIEAVTSHGPISPKRIVELEDLTSNCPSGKVFVTAFPDMNEFKKHSNNIAWETEVWLLDVPDHMIHFNGDKFFGPRTQNV